MATFNAVAAVSRALLGLIEEHCPPGLLLNPEYKLYHAPDFERPMGEGFSLFLYRVSINASMRNLPPRRTPDGRRYRPSLPLDLHYLLTPWAADPERQQRMLGWSMRFLEDLGTLPAGLLNHYVQETDTFRAEEAVEVVCDPLALPDYLNLWDKLKPKMHLSVTYALRMVMLDSTIESPGYGLVQTREFGMGKAVTAP
jgi:hypothetical protein